MQTVIGAFDDKGSAEQAVERLVDMGFDRSDVHVEGDPDNQPTNAERLVGQEHEVAVGRRGFFATLFGLDDDDRHAAHANTWSEATRRGSAVVVIDAADEMEAERAASLLHELGAVDIDQRAAQWRAQGWSGDEAAGAGRAGDVGDRRVLDVVQEELDIGKRRLDRGGVRVVERVSQRPVREIVQLRDERAVVDRRAVDRPASAEDFAATGGNAIEVREMTEEPVVSKKARVVEEVRLGKEVRERQETVEETVRRKDVDVQRLDGTQTRGERERAVASDRSAGLPLSERERGNVGDGEDSAEARDVLGRKQKPTS